MKKLKVQYRRENESSRARNKSGTSTTKIILTSQETLAG